MFLTRVLSRARLDRRPLYRRIITNKRLDFIFLTTVRCLVGLSLSLTSIILTDLVVYCVYAHPEKKRIQTLIEKELIKADSAGFQFPNFCGGATLELIKIHWWVNGINFYSIFTERKLCKELEAYEKKLKRYDDQLKGNRLIKNAEEEARGLT